jgi:DNA-binding beta-propeller fold protein YncE
MTPGMIGARVTLTALMLLVLRTPARGQEALVVVTAEGAGALTILSRGAPTSVELQGRPHNLVLSPDGKRAWVTDASASRVWVVEVLDHKVKVVPIHGVAVR